MGHVDTYYVDLTQDDPVLNEDADWKIFSCQLQVTEITQVVVYLCIIFVNMHGIFALPG